MSGSQQSGTTTTVQKADPWAGQQPYLKQAFSGAQNLYQNYTPGYYPNSTNAPMNEWQGNSLQGLYQRGIGGSAVDAGAQGLATDTLNGAYLGEGNPYFSRVAENITNAVTPGVMSQFEASGRYGSGAAAHALASALSDKIGNLAYQGYDAERQRQMQTMGISPSISATDFSNLSAANQAGNALQSQQQQAINADAARYNYYQQLPQQMLNNYAGIATGNVGGGTSSVSQPYYTNPMANALGLGTGLLGLGNMAMGGTGLLGGSSLAAGLLGNTIGSGAWAGGIGPLGMLALV